MVEWLAVAASVGISYHDFMAMTPAELVAVSRGYQKRMDTAAWLFGRYTHEALSAVLSAALDKKGRTPYRYPSQPYSAAEAPQEATDDDRDALRAKIYMRQMMRAGKHWGNTQHKGR